MKYLEEMINMEAAEKKRIIQDIIEKRRLPYALELIEVKGDEYTVINNFGSEITYIKKDDDYFLKSELE
jgi:hypothetical protein